VSATTSIVGLSGRMCRVHQSVKNAEGAELLEATSVYGWTDKSGQPVVRPGLIAPERREAR
jgi:hypothetical protein